MIQKERWQLPIFHESRRRMTFEYHEPVVGVEGASTRPWLHAADIVVGQLRTRRQARRWISSIHRRYPGCLLAVARQRRGRWCLVGLPARNIMVRGGTFDLAAAEQMGRVIYHLWTTRRRAQT
jgi:hypothetical protein